MTSGTAKNRKSYWRFKSENKYTTWRIHW